MAGDNVFRAGHGGEGRRRQGCMRKLCLRCLSGTPAAWQGGAESSGLLRLWGWMCLGDSALSLPSLTLSPFLPGSRVPSLAALRDMPVSTSTPPQTSLSARKSSGT